MLLVAEARRVYYRKVTEGASLSDLGLEGCAFILVTCVPDFTRANYSPFGNRNSPGSK